mgnify:CR=1 FL=1
MALTNVASGATRVSKVLNAVNQEVTIWCAGQAKLGISIRSVTGTPTLKFFGSLDGLTFNPITVGAYPSATPPASGVTSATAAGDYEVNVQNYHFIRVQMTSGAGPATVVMAASVDSSYQEAFMVGQSSVNLTSTLYPSTTATSGVNTQTVPGQANRTINLTFLEISMIGPNFGNAQLRIWDGAVGNGVPLYQCFITSTAGSVGTIQKINLPEDAQGNIGLQGTPGNAMNIQIVNSGNMATIINSRVSML